MLYLKVVTYIDDIHQGFDTYEARRIRVRAEEVTMEGCGDGSITLSLDYPENHRVLFFIMNEAGDTIDKFPADWLRGSAERTQRVREAAERMSAMPDSLAIIKTEGGEIHVGRHVRKSGSIATVIDFRGGVQPWFMDDHTAGQLAHALLHGAFAPDAP